MRRKKDTKDPNLDIVAAINRANRELEIELHGKPIAFRRTIQDSKKKYKRNKKVTLTDDL